MGDILFLAHRLPFPPDRGDKIRAFNILRHLSEKRRVHLAAFAEGAADLERASGLAPYTASRSVIRRSKSQVVAGMQAMVSRQPLSLTAFDSGVLRERVSALLSEHPIETIYIFSSQMAQFVPVDAAQRVVMDFVDMDSAKFAAYAERERGPLRWVFSREARLLLQHEQHVAARADASLFVSEAEADLFRTRTGAARVHAIENGIDTAHFDPAGEFARVGTTGKRIVFTGQMDYRPNVEAVTWFARSVLPRIRAAHPDASFAIVGRNPASAVTALAREPQIEVTGEVADVRGWLASAEVAVAPLKIARGVQNKVLEAMAMARAVVATEDAAQGIDHAGALGIADDAEGMAEAVSALLDDAAHAAELGASARRQVIRRYGWNARLAPLDALLDLSPETRRRTAA